jgi:hypothetical protein
LTGILAVAALGAVTAANGQPPRVIPCGTAAATDFYTVNPCRIFDTRDTTPLGAGETRAFAIAGVCGVPANAVAVSVNLTAVNPTADGDITAFPTGETLPGTTAISFIVGTNRANNAVLKLGSAGQLSFRNNQPSGTAHLVLDVNGYFQ